MTKTYKIVRFHSMPNVGKKDMQTGLSLEEAREHCTDPETNSASATSAEAKAYTEKHGAWFDGYTAE